MALTNSLAISPYVSRAQKAIYFYQNAINKSNSSELMLAIGRGIERVDLSGVTYEWENPDKPPIPPLDTRNVSNILGFKRFSEMSFVIPDDNINDFNLSGISWRRLTANTEEELYKTVINESCRWIYILTELTPTELLFAVDDTDKYFRQCGLYSHIQLVPSADTSSNVFTLDDILLDKDTGEPDAILEVIENRVAALRQTASNEVFAWILEF